MKPEQREIRVLVRSMYDLQKLRIEVGNRVVAEWKAQHGVKPGEKEEGAIEEDAGKLIKDLTDDHKRLTDGLVRLPTIDRFKPSELISSFAMLSMVDSYSKLLRDENDLSLSIKKIVERFPIWKDFMEGVRGVGHTMAGVILSEIDIELAKYPSSIWKYAGLDVAKDGRGRSRTKDHLVETSYIDKEGKEQTKMGITFSPFLKTKMVGVLGSSFVKQPADKCKYREVYDNYKHRIENDSRHAEKS